ncbi:MAG: VWA domain-containing protein [Saprospiraceae bacterium]|nr:VWA domain-containing protein [Saprospiraceae bacterium]
MEDSRLQKWRLILGKQSDPEGEVGLEGEAVGMDDVLEALYNNERKGGLGSSSPNVNRWLGDIRKYFPTTVVQIMQKDAVERLQLQRLLLEPELLQMVEPDVSLVATMLSLNKVMPQKTKETARMVIRKVVEELEKKLHNPLRQAIEGALNRAVRNRRPKLTEVDWNRTIRLNLKHYQADYQTIIPELIIGHGRKGQSLRHVILLVDQSGSMAASVVYAGVMGAIMASLKSVRTHFIAFDTAVVDLTSELKDPVDLLFGTQLGGGTDINKAMGYAQGLIQVPSDTILVLISDLYEGGSQSELLKKCAAIKSAGVNLFVLLALDDKGAPSFDKSLAATLASLDIPSFACTPDKFPELMEAAIARKDLNQWGNQQRY